jgi:alpha-1,6-mannosyltransferase
MRDALTGGVLLLLLYLPFMSGRTLPLGAVPNVVAHIRFNGPAFKAIAALASPERAAAAAVVLGLVVAAWARLRLDETDAGGWAWPMAAALACAPVIYPWYLLYLTPFLVTSSTIPLIVWTLSALPVYVVWDLSRHGGRWIVPVWTMTLEFAPVLAALVWTFVPRRRPAA